MPFVFFPVEGITRNGGGKVQSLFFLLSWKIIIMGANYLFLQSRFFLYVNKTESGNVG